MKIELRKVKHSPGLSQETEAYAAEVWVDGVKRGTTRNAGHGGPDEIYPPSLEQEIEAHARTLPKSSYRGTEFHQSAESVLGDLLARHIEGKRLERMMRTKTVLVKGGKAFTVKGHGLAPKPGEEVLNGLPFDEALTKFLAAASA